MSYPRYLKVNFNYNFLLEADYSKSNSCLFHQKYEQKDAYSKHGELPDSYNEYNTSIHQVWWNKTDFDINDIEEQLKMEVISISTIKQDPGNIIPMHKDIFKKIKDQYDVTGKKIVRANIHLDEWNPGQVIQYQKNGEWKSHTHWKVNDGLMFDDSCLHIGMNGGLKPKYTMQISGFYNGKVI